ncbi:SDR family NAD(P)-dependent oxidoreductase [Caballeronia sp. Lep1P3]|uniref:SDR family NAD(P)-dependent oxidoreductase n=1 Tax=Caballeronia sp. Lep1P3 TaxID=2878150 RepID=UPI00351CF514
MRLLLSGPNVDLIDTHADPAVRIGELPDSNLIATRSGSLRLIVCASPRFLAGIALPSKPDDLVKHACVVFNSPYLSPWRTHRLDRQLFRRPCARIDARCHCASKSALVAFAEGLARELGTQGVTANLLQPGSIDTDMNPVEGPFGPTLEALTATGDYEKGEDIAQAVVSSRAPARIASRARR